MKKRLLYVELLRVLAIVFVIFNHTVTNGYLLFTKRPAGSTSYWVYLAISVFCKFAVPVFFMISGALLLGKNEPLKVLWRKRILRMAIVLVVVSFIYYFAEMFLGKAVPFHKFLIRLYATGTMTHLWFLYAYIGFLIALPFLRALVQKLDTKYFYYLLALKLFFVTVDFLAPAFGLPQIYSRLHPKWVFDVVVIFPAIGYFMEHRVENKYYSIKQLLVLWAINIVAIAWTCIMTYEKGAVQEYCETFSLVNAVCVFYSAKVLFKYWRPRKKTEWLICALGSSAFGVYLIHVLPLTSKLTGIVMGGLKGIGINTMVACWIWCFVLFLACSFVVWLVKKIPFMRKYI